LRGSSDDRSDASREHLHLGRSIGHAWNVSMALKGQWLGMPGGWYQE
jgi:hypothetical protein